MAGQLIRECIDNTRSKPTARLVLLVLAERANGNRYCWPSIATIAKDTGLTERGATKALNELRSLGEIHSQRIARRRTLGYLVTLGLTEEQIIERLTADPFNVKLGEAKTIARNLVTLRGEDRPKQKTPRKKPVTLNNVQVNNVQVNDIQVNNIHPQYGTTFTPNPEQYSPPYEPSLEPSYEPEESDSDFGAKSAPLKPLIPKPIISKPETPKPVKAIQPHIAIIDAWHAAIPESIRPPGGPVYQRHVKVGQMLATSGITAEQVTRFVSESYPNYLEGAAKKGYTRVMSLEYVRTHIKGWLSQSAPIVGKPAYLSPEEFYRQQQQAREQREQRIMQSPREQYEAEKRRKEGVK